jgi:hypothetical protein
MKAKLVSIKKYCWNLEFQNKDGYSFPYWLILNLYSLECGGIGFNPYREIRKHVNYDYNKVYLDGDTFVDYIYRGQI